MGLLCRDPSAALYEAIAEAGTEAVTSVAPVLRTLDACIRPDLDAREAVKRIEALVRSCTEYGFQIMRPSSLLSSFPCPWLFWACHVNPAWPCWLCSPCCVANVIGRERERERESRGTDVLALNFLIMQQQKGAEVS